MTSPPVSVSAPSVTVGAPETSQFLRRLARRPFAHPHPPLFERDFASLEMQYLRSPEMQYLRSPEMHTARIGAATVTFLKDVYWAKTYCTATLPSTCQPQGLLNAACVRPADRREAHAL